MQTVPRQLLHAFSTFKLGGPQARFVELANAFGPQFQHQIVAMDGCFDAGERLNPDVVWQPVRLPNHRGGGLANRSAFRTVLSDLQPDLLLTYNWGAIEWTAANFPRRVPQVHVEDGFGADEALRQLPRRVWTRRLLLGLTRTPVVVASRHLEQLATEVWRLPSHQVRFFPNGVDLPSELPIPRLVDAQRPLVVGTVSGLRPEKNIARLLRAFAVLRQQRAARLLVVGDGPERPALEALAESLGIRADVEFMGYQTNPLAILPRFDLFALSSNTEQLPIAMLEAMAWGVPVVATRVGDVALVLPTLCQVALAEPEDAAFERALLRVVGLRQDWPSWIEANQRQVRQFYSKNIMLNMWQKVFDGQIGLAFANRTG